MTYNTKYGLVYHFDEANTVEIKKWLKSRDIENVMFSSHIAYQSFVFVKDPNILTMLMIVKSSIKFRVLEPKEVIKVLDAYYDPENKWYR